MCIDGKPRQRQEANYDLIDTIGSGGMGLVYKAKHKKLDKTMAVKCLHRELAADPINVSDSLRK